MKYLIAGLGNIGPEYSHTRHNIGFDIVNAFSAKHGATLQQQRLAYVAEVRWKSRIFVCICPTTYMNLSGKAVKYWLDKEGLTPDRMLVLVDDVAVPLDRVRLRASGSDGGHNGLRSIAETLQTTEYPRLRFGVGNNFPKGRQSDFVLGKWYKEEEPLVKLKIEACVEAIEIFAISGIAAAMNQLNNKSFTL